jgi:2-keto-3-deoxy-L-rhamnonate aldolase RhmA
MNRVQEIIREKGAPLLGIATHTGDPAFVEIAGMLGYDVLWIEMEHASITFAQAANVCRLADAMGMLTMIRIPDARRENVLKAAECRPAIIDLPMANTPEVLRELVDHAKYAPEGRRGFFMASRAVRYGMVDDIARHQQQVNSELCLVGQIETREAVEHAEELCAVDGIGGILIGPGDLSASMGVPGQMSDPEVQAAMDRIISAAKDRGKLVLLPAGFVDIGKWKAKGIDVLFGGSDLSCLRMSMKSTIEEARAHLR